MIRKFAFITTTTVVASQATLFLAALYNYPELRHNKLQLLSAMRRGMRCSSTGFMMAVDYL